MGFAGDTRQRRGGVLDAYGVEDAALDDLDQTPGLIGRAHAERGDAPLASLKAKTE